MGVVSIIRANIRQFGMILALVAIAVLFQISTGGTMFRPMNIANLITQNGYILILAVGMMFVILTGRIDLSVGTHLAFASALSGVFMVSWGWPVWFAVPAILVIGALFGAWHGFWIAYMNIPFFVVTLAGMLIFRGLTMSALEGGTITNFPPAFHTFAAGFIPDFVGGAGLNLTAILICMLVSILLVFLEFRKRIISSKYEAEVLPLPFLIVKLVLIIGVINLFGVWFAQFRGVPNIMILLVGLIVIYNYIANNTTMGRHVYATGGNEKAAVLNGLKTKRVVFWVYVNMGMLAALAGMVFASRMNAASPRAEAGFELEAIAACFIGGASPGGGVGKVTGAIIGAMVMGVLRNGLFAMGLGAEFQLIITGLVVLAAVTFDVFTRTKVGKSEKLKAPKA